jgi:ankyrin repeat protein
MMDDAHKMYGAVIRGDVGAVRGLVASAPAVLKDSFVEKSWVHWAAQMGRTEILEVLLDAGLSVDLLSDAGETPLEIAAGQGHYGTCEWLLDHNADINQGLGQSATPVFSAIFSQSLDLVKLFVARGADLGATFGDPKIDILSYAGRYGTPAITEFLGNTMNRHET